MTRIVSDMGAPAATNCGPEIRPLDGLGTDVVSGNQARLLENGDAAFPEMLASLASVRQ